MTRRYPAYKDSGVEWLGEVPVTWEVSRVKSLFEIKKRIVGELGYDVLSVTQNGIRVRDTESNDGQVSMDYSKYQIVEPDDFVMNHMDLLTGYVDISRFQGVTSPDYRVFTARHSELSSRYFLYLFQNGYRRRIFYAFGQGASEFGRWRMPTDNFNDFKMPHPPLPEQTAIASFLDRETAKIDALVAEQRRLIDLLREKRQAVISHAVTRGLNPNAPLKPSGIDWLGDVPEGWEVLPLKRVTLERCDGPFGSGLKSEHYVEAGMRVVRLQNIKADGFSNDDAAFIDLDYASSELSRHAVLAGDVLIAGLGDERNLVGRACVAPIGIEPAMVKADCFRFRLDTSRAASDFVALQLNASAAFDAGTKATGTTRSRIPLSQMAERALALPPLAEQHEIAGHVQMISDCFDLLTATAETAIALLQERRTALISAAVTGKIDVRHLVQKEEEAA